MSADPRISTEAALAVISDFSIVSLWAGDEVLRAWVRVPISTGTGTFSLELNGTMVTSLVGGPWSTTPLEIDVTQLAGPAGPGDPRLYARMGRNGGTAGQIQFQLLVLVRR